MKILLLCGLWLVAASSAAAFSSFTVEPSVPYEPYQVAPPFTTERVYLGTLDSYPDMYEVASTEEFSFTLALATLPDTAISPALSVIIVKVNDSGVAEVARIPYAVSAWSPERQSTTGLLLLAGPTYEATLDAGVYRIEISTPDNVGQYVLTMGTESEGSGYFATLRSIAAVYDFAGQSKWGMVRSSYIHVPLAMVLVVLLLGATWRWRKYFLT